MRRSLRRDGVLAAFLLMLGACGSPQTASPPVSRQPCALGALTLEVPVERGFALAVSEGACLLVDERAEGTLVSFATLPSDAEGAPLLDSDPRRFWRESGLLGDDLRFTGTGELEWLGDSTRVDRFVATPDGLRGRAGFVISGRRGNQHLLVLGLHALGESDLERLVSLVLVSP